MDEAIKIVSLFVPKGTLVVSQKGRNTAVNAEYRTMDEPVDTLIPLMVMVNSGSASSSEIVAGAIHDLDRGTIIGTRTFGKGLVQSMRSVGYDGFVKLTIAKYYTPSPSVFFKLSVNVWYRTKKNRCKLLYIGLNQA